MLQSQYYNLKLSKTHIEKILTNYTIKYNTMKNEIDAKFNNMIKLFVNDIRAFLENIEEISNERKKIKEAQNAQLEISVLKSRLEEKTTRENKMKTEIDSLTRENAFLKNRIKIQNKPKNLNVSELTKSPSFILKTESKPYKSKYKKFMTNSQAQLKDKDKDRNDKYYLNTSTSKPKAQGGSNKKGKKRTVFHQNNHLSVSMDKRSMKELDNNKKTKNSKVREAHHSVEKKLTSIKNKAKPKNKNRKNASIAKTPRLKNVEFNTIENTKNNNQNLDLTDLNEKYSTLELQRSDEESVGGDDSIVTVDDVIEEEIKELEQDEENIILLMDQIKQFQIENGGIEDYEENY